jgi:hypothetical protein
MFYSDYFHAAFGGSFREATEGKISLPDEREDVFDIFNHFIYSRVIADEKEHEFPWAKLVRIWLFGDKYMIPSLQNSAMDALVEKYKVNKVTPASQIRNIWEKTLPSSPLRKFILDRAVYKINLAKRKLDKDKWTQEALLDLVMAYANREDVEKWHLPVQGKCHYHIHKEGEEC